MDINYLNDSDNSDIDEIDQDATLPWMESNVSCYICNGYYGPSFEEPVCGTCHAFLFPDMLDHLEQLPITVEKTDDDDSGNDEPVDLYYCIGEARPVPVAGANEDMAEPHAGIAPVDPAHDVQEIARPETPPPIIVPPTRPLDLERRLEMLSEPREPDAQIPMVQKLPPEVLLAIFGYLDDLSLCNAAAVCSHWRHLLKTHISPSIWRRYTIERWPLFQPLVEQDWFKTYTGLMSSCFCRTCLIQMALQSSPLGEENSWRRNRLRNELKIMRSDPPEGIEAVPLDGECCHWQAAITGPVGSPYEGGLFYLYVQVPYSYPMMPPRVRFLTRILHPNVSRHGDVGIDSIQHNWSLALTISKVLISVQSLLTDPFTLVCMEPSLGHMYRVDRSAFEKLARKWTWKYAMMDALPL